MNRKCGVLLFIFIVIGCSPTSDIKKVETSYDIVIESIKKLSNDDNPLLDYISISNVENYELSKIDELEYDLSFTFTIANITERELSMDFIWYVPEQLKSYFLVRETFEGYDVTLKPGQELNSTFGVLVLNPYKLDEPTQEFLNKHGEKLYMHFIIDGKDYFYELIINDN